MKTTASQKVKIGAFIVVGLVVVFLGIFLIGNQKSMFSSTFNVNGVFKNVSGLQIGNNVRFAGITVGVVQGIDIVNDTSVRVTLTLKEEVKKFIKKDAKMSIGSDGLMGDKLVVIGPGMSNETVQDGSTMASVNPLDVDKIINKLTKIADNAAVITEGLGGIVQKVNSGQGSIGRLLTSDKLSRNLESTVAQAKQTMATVQKTTNTANEDLQAAKSNFLLRGFFKKKEKAKQDSLKKIQKAKEAADKQAEKDRKAAEKAAKDQQPAQ